MLKRSMRFLAIAALTPAALAQSNVAAGNKYSWGETLGWMNWSDANSRIEGVRLYPRFLAGYVWGENVGWIGLGKAVFVTDVCNQYPPPSAQTATSYGVNIDTATGQLNGYGWGENTGWVYFGSQSAVPAPLVDPPRLTTPAPGVLSGRLNGYAWSENAGWINLSVLVPGQFVTFNYPNCDGSTSPPVCNINDFQCFLNSFAAGSPYANCDRSTAPPCLNVNDFQCFINQYAAGCS